VGSIKSLVLLSGPIAAGKTSVREELLARHGYHYVRSSAYLMDLASKQGQFEARTSLQDLGDRLDSETDYRWVLDEVARPAFAADPSKLRWLVDAVRKRRQVEHFRDAFGLAVTHVHLTAPEEILERRYTTRLSTAKDATPYKIAIQHENEVASRRLVEIADLILDTSTSTPLELARLIAASDGRQR
jgi:chloramphenicol 3-O-phosphotransferase